MTSQGNESYTTLSQNNSKVFTAHYCTVLYMYCTVHVQ